MYEQITYKNHLNEQLVFGSGQIWANYNDLRDYTWSFISDNDRIGSFSRGVVTKTLPVVLFGADVASANSLKNQLYEYTEKDVLTKLPGRLYIGDYYLSCYVVGITVGGYLLDSRYLTAELTVVSDMPYWVKEIRQMFLSEGGGGLNYPSNYPFNYANPYSAISINNTSFDASDFRLIINGSANAPTVSIAGHTYAVSTIIGVGEYLEIDSRAKTVTLVQSGGTRVNKFADRDRTSYIFERIPSGQSSLIWDGSYNLEITLYDKRSVPKWT